MNSPVKGRVNKARGSSRVSHEKRHPRARQAAYWLALQGLARRYKNLQDRISKAEMFAAGIEEDLLQLLEEYGQEGGKDVAGTVDQMSEALRTSRSAAARRVPAATKNHKRVIIQLQRLSRSKQSRLATLLDRSNDGALTGTEQAELKRLGEEVDEMMLSNSMALARAVRPEFFNADGQLIKRRFRQAFGRPSAKVRRTKRESTQT